MINLAPGYYESEPMAIQKHEWRIVKYLAENSIYAGWVIRYEWRRIGDAAWWSAATWPSYNHDDHLGGLPRSLKKLWKREEAVLTGISTGQMPLL